MPHGMAQFDFSTLAPGSGPISLLADKEADSVHLSLIVILVLLGFFLSAATHESGHLLVGKMAGLKVVFIQIIPPGVGLSGEATRFWNAAISVSGMLLAVLVGLAGALAIVLLQEEYPCVKYAIWLFVPMMAQALLWFALSVVAVFGAKTPDGDILKFAQQTEWPPLVVSLIGLVPVVLCAAILKRVWG
jgi:hypothetical protein